MRREGRDPRARLVLVDVGVRRHPLTERPAERLQEHGHQRVRFSGGTGSAARDHEMRLPARGVEARQGVDGGLKAVLILDCREGGTEAMVCLGGPGQRGLDFGMALGIHEQRASARDVEQQGAQRLAQPLVLGTAL